MSGWRFFLAVATALGCTLVPAWALADARERTIELIISGPATDGGAAEAAAMEGSVRELLGRLQVSVGAAGSSPHALARVQVDLSSPLEIVLLVSDPSTGRMLERRSVPRDASSAVIREEVAHAVQSAVAAELLVDADRPAEAPPTEPPVEPTLAFPPHDMPARPSAARPWAALDVIALVGVGAESRGSGPVPRAGGGFALASRRGLRPTLTLAVADAASFDSRDFVVVAHASSLSTRAVGGVDVVRTPGFALGVGVGGGADVLKVEPSSPVLPASRLGPSTTRVDPIVAGVVTAHFAVSRGVAFTVTADADVDLVSRHYVVDFGDRRETLFDPWRVRPALLAGFTFTALGEGIFEAGPVR
jgi:hypothetical protein